MAAEVTEKSHNGPASAGGFHVQIAVQGGDFERFRINDPVPTGRQLIALTSAQPIEEHLIFFILDDGSMEELRLDETIDLRERGVETFIVFESSASYRYLVDAERREWGCKFITGRTILKAITLTPETHELWKEVRGGQDEQVAPKALVDLSVEGLERFYTKEKEPKTITIIVNGRVKEIEGREICFEDLIAFAFPTPPTGKQICYTVMYRRGGPDKPEGSLVEGQCVKAKKGMVFNVSYTDKS